MTVSAPRRLSDQLGESERVGLNLVAQHFNPNDYTLFFFFSRGFTSRAPP
jgi:hypothetical protein